MRDFGKVHSSFWSSKTIRDIPPHERDDARTLACYLLTSPHTTASGVFRLPAAYALEDLQWVSERLSNGFETLSKVGFVKRDNDSGWVWICKWHTWNRPENPNVRKSIERALLSVPSSVSFANEALSVWGLSRKGFVTVTKPQSLSPSLSSSLDGNSEFESLPVDDGSLFDIPQELVAEFTKTYPRVDLGAEFAKMRMWLLASPANRKTRRGMVRFMNSWLARAPERNATTRAADDGGSPASRRKLV